MLALLAGAAVRNVHWMAQQRRDATNAAANLIECREHGKAIESLRESPAVASTHTIANAELGERIESAAKIASLPNTPRDVSPQAARPLGNLPYVVKPTILKVKGASLGQLAAFLHYLTDESVLTIRELTLRTPRGKQPEDVWDADVTVTHLTYVPAAATRDKGGKAK
jgi:hypothetical protein